MLDVVSQQQCTCAFTVCWTCKSSSDHLATHLPHRHLTLDTLELWEPDAAPSWEHKQSHQSSGSVTTFKSSYASDSHILAFHHNGHLHNLIHEQYLVPQQSFGSPGWWALSLHNLDDLQWNSEALDVQHQSLYYQRNDRRCRLHNWSVHHSVELELLKLVRMFSMSSTHFQWT